MLRFVDQKGAPSASPALRRTVALVLVCLLFAHIGPTTPRIALAQSTGPAVTVQKTIVSPANGEAAVGSSVVYQITLINSGSTTIDVLPLADTFDPTYLRFTGATVGGIVAVPDLQATNVISWTDLTLLPQVGNVAPGGSVTLQTTFTALAVTEPGSSLNPPSTSGLPGTPATGTTALLPNPNDYYDKETRFIIDHAIDQTNGGIYLAVRGDGTLWGPIPDVIYGFPANFFVGSTKHPGGQALCMEYFMREYQRLSDTGRTIQTSSHGVQGAKDMLGWAKNCADFVNAHMIIGKGQNEPAPPACTIGDGNKCLYYWGFVDAAGTSGQRPATGSVAGFSAPNSHHLMDSFVAWMQAELARVLRANNDPSYTTYKQAAYNFWNWAQLVGAPYNPQIPSGSNPSFAGRDRFLPGLLMALYELSNDEGAADPTLRANAINCVNQVGIFGANIHQRGRCNGSSYTAAYGRAAAHAMDVQHRGIDNYYLPGAKIFWHNYGDNRYSDNPETPNNPTTPFAHGSGRELVAGLQRAHWFYYTFPKDADIGTNQVPAGYTVESWSHAAILAYWKYSIDHMWDATPGQEAWWDAQLVPGREGYKPCFSLGTPVPVADWQAPQIGNKVHTLNADGSATVTVSGVNDADWPYLSWQMRGIGVSSVRVLYSVDGGATWVQVPATATAVAGTYVATIPPQPNQTVIYYAEAQDDFGNISTFPANAPQVYQLYTFRKLTYNLAWSVGGRDTLGNTTQGSSEEISLGIVPQPTAVTLARLEATAQNSGVQLGWQTSSEENSYGFNVYRGSKGDRSDAVRLNQAIITSRGSGSQYSFFDNTPASASVYYWLEEIDLDGQSSWYRITLSPAPSGSTRVLLPVVKR